MEQICRRLANASPLYLKYKARKDILKEPNYYDLILNYFPDHYFFVQRLFHIPLNGYGTKIHTFQSWFNQVGMYSIEVPPS